MSSTLMSPAFYTLGYVAICVCFVLRTREFVSAGLDIESIFARILKNERDDFVYYHIKRTSLTIFIHSLLPLGLFLLLIHDIDEGPFFWTSLFLTSSLTLFTALMIFYWHLNSWANHPIAKKIKKFDNMPWNITSYIIGVEYNTSDKLELVASTLTKTVITTNWIMKVSPYTMDFAENGNSALILSSADTHQVSIEGEGSIQYINIEVKSIQPKVKPFTIRCNSLDFQDLQAKIRRPIVILDGITFHKTMMDRFLEVFKQTIELNPPFKLPKDHELEVCIGCMVARPAVKLVKTCRSSTCITCNCRPLWCMDCMGKWFASRQDQNQSETWLSSTCTCPVCRSVFCMLDVCPIESSS